MIELKIQCAQCGQKYKSDVEPSNGTHLLAHGSGRFDAYWERGLRLWDVAAGGLIVECAGGEYWRETLPGKQVYNLIANNGRLRKKLERATAR